MKPIAGVVFDLEGTVVDMEPAHHEAHIRAAAAIGVHLTMDRCLDGKTLPHFIGGPDEAIAKEVVALISDIEVGSEQWDSSVGMFLANDKAVYDSLMRRRSFEPRPGFREVLDKVRMLGFPVAIGSSTPLEYAELLLGHSGLLSHFPWDRIVLGQKSKDGKAVPDVWIRCAAKMGVPSGDLLIFEDSPRGITGAVQVGASCVGMPVYNQWSVIGKLYEAGATRVFVDWREMDVHWLIQNLNEEREKMD